MGAGKRGLAPALGRLRCAVANGLVATARLWSPLQTAHAWIRRAAQVLANDAGVVPWNAQELRPRDVAAGRQLRAELEARHERRRTSLRFRRDPTAYLAALEAQLL